MSDTQETAAKGSAAPNPDDPRKPDSITDIKKRSWTYVLGKTFREFSNDQCTDLAAALTYYTVLSIFPALLAFVSVLGLFSDPQQTTESVLGFVQTLMGGGGANESEFMTILRGIIEQTTNAPAAGLGLVTGILGALWSASGFVGAFSRASNRIYEVQEGRSPLVLRPTQLLVTTIAVVLLVVAAILVVLSGPVAETIGSIVGLGPQVVFLWDILKWPVVVVIGVVVIAILYYFSPNVQQPKFRWISVGAGFALFIWALASVGFFFYVANFSSYASTYGSLAGVIIFLLWIWISNNALLFGAELDAELERGRQLQAGIPAEETLQLPPRSTAVIEKKADAEAKDVLKGLEIRLAHDHANSRPHSWPEKRRRERMERKARKQAAKKQK
ncbi:YihY/virulence factor BrkB family protein [Herbiconiux sp. SYSU D00978]|uniref:YihY/virulence factor BrkB family protein n=1 Tax=Herbiconiux sp. SYSU D00978 TaxID=2812562 RepID=UPI001A9695F3|nr:YihY/virulence factor BrkB family protein [Herbiconiux sp. SYSU D00978]